MSRKNKFLKALFLSALLPVVAFSASMDARVEKLEKDMAMSSTSNPMGGMGAKNGSGLPETKNTHWHAKIGFVYDQPRVGGSMYAIKTNTPSENDPITQDVRSQDFKYSWGVNFGLGYITERKWDCSVDYLYFDSSNKSRAFAGRGSAVLPVRSKFNIAGDDKLLSQVALATSKYNIGLNSIDASLSNSFYTQENFTMGFKGAMRTQWLSLKQDITYTGGPVLGDNSVYVNDKSRYWGIGPAGTIMNNWNLGKGFSLYGNTTLALLYGRFDVHQEQIYSLETNKGIHTQDGYGRVIPEVEMNIGLMYGTYVGKGNHFLSFKLGWDFRYLFRVNQMLANMDSYTSNGSSLAEQRRSPNFSEDMSMQGLMFDFRWDF